MRGRKPKPSYLRVLDGNAGHRPANLEEPAPAGDLVLPPAELNETQQRVWRDAMACAPPGMLKLIDGSVFRNWVIATDMVEQLRADVQRYGRIIKGKDGAAMVNPLLRELRGYMDKVRQHAAELGFSPTARPRVKVPKPTKAGNPFADLKSLGD